MGAKTRNNYVPRLVFRTKIDSPLDSYCVEHDKDSTNDAYDLKTLKDFMNEVAYDMNGVEREDDPPSLKSVKQVWKRFYGSISTGQ